MARHIHEISSPTNARRAGGVTLADDGTFTIEGNAIPPRMHSILRELAHKGVLTRTALPATEEPMDPMEATMLVMGQKEQLCRELREENERLAAKIALLEAK